MKIAIGICNKTAGRCSSLGCFRAYNSKTKNFEEYEDIETELIAFFNCGECIEGKEGKLDNMAKRLAKEGVDRVHIGHCALKCIDIIRPKFEDLGLIVVEGTH